MKIELISIGDELLKGKIVNTNAAFLSQHLQQKGFPVSRQTTLSDEKNALASGLKEALARSDLVICTGGLGPTLDDCTRQIAAELYACDFRFDQATSDDLKRRYGDRYNFVDNQATIPARASILYSRVGAAPGVRVSEGRTSLILMPGVPKEMEPMFVEQVLPLIEKKWPPKQKKEIASLSFCLVYESLLDPHLRELSKKYPAVEAGIYPSHGALSVLLLSSDAKQLSGFEKELIFHFGDYHFLSPHGKIEEALHSLFVKQKKTLAFAESCTGGMMSSLVTSVPGASDYFLGSFVTYCNSMKEQLLGVSPETLRTKGAVSEEVVREMLEGVFKKTNADYAIAVSGIAGPTGGTEQKPVGMVCAAIGARGKTPEVGTFKSYGSRQTVILMSSNYLLGALWRKLEKGIPAFPLLKQER
ncbi:MAG: CinA family nicotinamide mononucleotide deamidase-related protein [Candidatus Melainabacteria bacterium]|nr:CinA family nicotinamide mononucleotide deamidase-related protein [Candidatus Melainabacteria bacterium]